MIIWKKLEVYDLRFQKWFRGVSYKSVLVVMESDDFTGIFCDLRRRKILQDMWSTCTEGGFIE